MKKGKFMEDQNKKLDNRMNHLPEAKGNAQEALKNVEELQRLSYSRAFGEGEFTLSDSRSLVDRAALHLYDARSAIARQMALDDGED